MKIAMIGAGYVGLVTGACLADAGHEVTCIDRDTAKIASLAAGDMPIYEPGLDVLVARSVAAGHLRFVSGLETGIAYAAAVFIAVGTPPRAGDGHADLGQVEAVVEALAPLLQDGQVLVTKSTVPVGTGDGIALKLAQLRPGLAVPVVSNPEFLREGNAIADFARPDRIVAGVEDDRARAVIAEIYAPYTAAGAPLLLTGRRTAELIKYAANAFLAMKVAYINEMADLAEASGADVSDIARGIGLDPRIGDKFLAAGPGFGGSCFPKDTAALLGTAETLGAPLRLVESALASNLARRYRMARKVTTALGGDVHNRTLAVLGLTFKPGTDDLRESPALAVIAELVEAGARIVAYDPRGMEAAGTMLPHLRFATDPYGAARNADAVILATEWPEFRDLDLTALRGAMRTPVFIDLRNVYSAAVMSAAGFTYRSVGRPAQDVG